MRNVLTVWLTPHIKTLRMGSLARNNFTFCPIKCFFFVLVLLALTGAALVQLDDMSQAENSGNTRRHSLSFRASTQRENRRDKSVLKKSISASCSSSNSQRVSGKDNLTCWESAVEHFAPSPPFLLPCRPRRSPESS